jgi:phage terminase small subunit
MARKRPPNPSNPYGLEDRHWRFCQELLIDDNAAQAAIRAGYSEKTAKQQACRLLTTAGIQRAVADLRAARAQRLEISADRVLQELVLVAFADPNELIELRRICCRFCHGKKFQYQRTAGEMKRDKAGWDIMAEEAKTAGSPVTPFDRMGGEGYDARKAPHANCPECFGEGVPIPFPKDTRNLSESARRLYAGIKVTKDGIEIKMRDQDAALVNIAKHLGMFVNKNEHSGKDGGTIPIEIVGIEIAEPGPCALCLERGSEDPSGEFL